jgi:hypothetical protein
LNDKEEMEALMVAFKLEKAELLKNTKQQKMQLDLMRDMLNQ